MRALGYYWVKYEGQWFIGDYYKVDVKCHWEIGHLNLDDEELDEIDERQIVRTEPKILKKAFEAGTNYATYNGRPGYPDAPNFEEWHKTWKKDIPPEKPKMSKEQITKAEELISDTIRKVDKLFGLL